jgi:hypothetical protein
MAAIDEDGEEPGNDHQRKPNCGSPGHQRAINLNRSGGLRSGY